MNLKEKIKDFRKNLNKTQQDLCEILGLPRYIVSNWEQGRSEPSADDLIKLADYFGCTTDYLLGREDDLGNVITGHTYSPTTEDEEKLLSAFRVLDEADRETFLIQITAIAKEKRLIK